MIESGALFDVSGTVANNATWAEDIYFIENGSGMSLTGLSFKMTFRYSGDDDSAALTLSTGGGGLSIVNDGASVSSILRITAPPSTLSGMEGDYICDLASQDQSDVVTLYAHGLVSFRRNPVSF